MNSTAGSLSQLMTDWFIWLRMSKHVRVHACACVLSVCRWLLLIRVLFAPTSEFRGWMSNSVELCPMPFGMPAVRYMAPTPRLFLASLAAFISSTVSPSSAKVWTPTLAGIPSSHSWKWRLWLTAKKRLGERSEMLIRWNAYQCRWDTTEPCPDDEIISTTEPVCTSTAALYFLQLKKMILSKLPHVFLLLSHGQSRFHLSSLDLLILWQHGLHLWEDGSGFASQTETARQTSKLELDFFSNNETILFAFH